MPSTTATSARRERNDRGRRQGGFAFIAAVFGVVSCVVLCATVAGCCAIKERYGGGNVPVGAYEPEQPNPLFVQTQDAEALWDAVVDVIDNYYAITNENPVRTYERVDAQGRTYRYQTEGRIDTEPAIMAGVQEPWRRLGAPCGDRWFATFQTVRSTANVRVVPEDSGFFIYLSIYDEIEDLPKPMGAKVGYNLSFNEDASQLTQAVGEHARSKGWIPIGRDDELEGRIMKEIAWRVGAPRTVIHEGIDAKLQP